MDFSQEIVKGIQAAGVMNWTPYYFRTKNGAEIDLILEGPFGILPVEIKFGSLVKQRQLQSLKRFVSMHDLPLGIVVNNSEKVRMVADRILQLPATFI